MTDDLQDPSPMSIVINTLTRLESKADAGFARIDAKLETKADKSDVAKLDTRLDGHERRIERTEDAIRTNDVASKTQSDIDAKRAAKRQNHFNWMIGSLSCAAIVFSALIALFH